MKSFACDDGPLPVRVRRSGFLFPVAFDTISMTVNRARPVSEAIRMHPSPFAYFSMTHFARISAGSFISAILATNGLPFLHSAVLQAGHLAGSEGPLGVHEYPHTEHMHFLSGVFQ